MPRSFHAGLLGIAFSLAMGACGTPHQVGFFDAVAAGPPPIEDEPAAATIPVTRIYIDANGSLYPAETLPADAVPEAHWKGSLFDHFRDNITLCPQSSRGEIGALCAAVPGQREDALDRWYSVQTAMWADRGKLIVGKAVERVRDKGTPEIVVLIHGFNNTMAEAAPNFAKARRLISAAAPDPGRLSVVEVYWDGCAIPGGVGCWGKAQGSGPLAGFSLRQLLNGIDEELAAQGHRSRIRVVTHSSGAFVIGAALGNPGRVLPNLGGTNWEYRRFARHARDASGPHAIPRIDDLRLAMFAPATPTATFTGQRPGEGLLAKDVRMLFTIQPDDRVLKKSAMGITIGCARAGATCMGLLPRSYCDEIRPWARDSGTRTEAIAYDFKRVGPYAHLPREEHAFGIYLEQASRPANSILADLMANAPQHTGALDCSRIAEA